jgi:hypothetical protein
MSRAKRRVGLIHLCLKDLRVYQSDKLPFRDFAVPIRIKSLDVPGNLAADKHINNSIEIASRGDSCLYRAAFNRNSFVGDSVL